MNRQFHYRTNNVWKARVITWKIII